MRIGIDIGGSKVLLGLVEEDGKIVKKTRFYLKNKDYSYIRDKVIEEIDQIAKGLKIEKIGIACAGQIEENSGKIIFSPNLSWQEVPLKEELADRFSIAIHIENDVNAATYGEWKFGLRSIPKDVIGVFIGTGIGGGIIIDGRLYRGFSGVGGEIGHMILNPHGYRCNCGQRGCFEAFCGGSYVVKRIKERIKEGYRGKIWEVINCNLEELHTGHVEQAYLMGDELCKKVWEEVLDYLGYGIGSLANIFNPEVVILGGGVIDKSLYMFEQVEKVLKLYTLSASFRALKLVKSELKEDAALVGAAFIEGF